MAAEGGAEVVRIARGVGDDVIAPVVEHTAMRVGEAIRHIAVEAARARLVAIDRAVHIAHGSLQSFHIRAVEDAIAEIQGTAGFIADRVRFMMRVSGIKAMHDAFLPVAFAIAIRVAHEPHVG